MFKTFKNVVFILLCMASDFKDFREKALVDVKRKVKESVDKDLMIINAINNIEELEKTFNSLTSRIREWFSLKNPEFEKSVEDNQRFIDKILNDELDSSEMGAVLDKSDDEAILSLVLLSKGILKTKKFLEDYLVRVMNNHCLNILSLAGPTIGAKLLREAGSLRKLSMTQSGTIQLLGAEKALFRHIKTGARPPKYGFIVNHQVVSGAKTSDRGKAARALADKLSVAARLDFFKGDFLGDKFLEELKLRFCKQ